MANLPAKRDSGPGVVAVVVGGVVGAVVLFWLVGAVIATVTFVVRIVVIVAVLSGAFWLWNKVKKD